ncbi:MAG: Hsp20/alpha crystallin family protein [Vicinamibacterales bacterium]|jgi:HSP20 family protein|nr:Hsp20/alpha crystallin family protein [Vicinamibacterales bacterium]MDP7690441.1 Hsp20/alpha crystallin family protein [Vicinamibacterales bacterium]HJN45181.1 Hsp20/alpha crystallin family protein [Vicinamibacterales bacterium]|tara:strand:- start:205 stop:648 length:444 start_codon:yes stop_codon:yes gene_type:complete
MSLVHWNPFEEFTAFDAPFNRMFRRVSPGTDEAARQQNWMPTVDVYETDDHALIVSAELPGVDRKDVSVMFEDGVLTIAGERKRDAEVDNGRMFRSERAYGTFRRSFTVPRSVDAGAVTAEHKDGTLRVRLPAKAEATPHRIAVKAA